MKPSVNILMTSLSNQGDRKSHRYFYYEGDGTTLYCDGLSVAEAGTKYILSEVKVDEIIVLGAGRTYDVGEENNRIALRDWNDYTAMDTRNLSEYTFFQYRIAQFLDGLDMEGVDVLEDIEPEREAELKQGYEKFCESLAGEPGYRPDRVFDMITSRDDLYEQLIDMMPDLSDKELLWVERYIYSKFADSMKLHCRPDNSGINITFIPTSKDQTRNYVPAQNVTQIIETLKKIDAEKINVYMDMQGLASTEGYMILSVLSMLSNDPSSTIQIKEIITSHYHIDRFASPIDNREMKRYDINQLMAGMSAFIRYGKVDEVKQYWNSRGIENEHISMLLYAMERVDEGISLCNTAYLEGGIDLLKAVFQNTPREELPEVESNIFRLLEDTIRRDYGPLLEGEKVDSLELVKWAMRKKFYQQSLTIIESRLPQDMVNSGFFFYADSEESRKTFMEVINVLYWDYLPKDRWNFDDLNHFFIKYYGRSQMKRNPASKDRQRDYTNYRLESLDGKTEQLEKSYSILLDRRDLLENVLYTYYRLGDIRNQVNHAADEKVKNLSEIDIKSKNESLELLQKGIHDFVEAYEAARQYVRESGKEITVLQITKDELKEYVNAHKLYPNDIRRIQAQRSDAKDGDKKPDDANGAAVPAKTGGDAPRGGGYNGGYRNNRGSYGRYNSQNRNSSNAQTISVKSDGDGKELLKVTITIEK